MTEKKKNIIVSITITLYIVYIIYILKYQLNHQSKGPDKPITPQANLAPAFPVFLDSSALSPTPLPKSSSRACTTKDLPNTSLIFTNLSLVS